MYEAFVQGLHKTFFFYFVEHLKKNIYNNFEKKFHLFKSNRESLMFWIPSSKSK